MVAMAITQRGKDGKRDRRGEDASRSTAIRAVHQVLDEQRLSLVEENKRLRQLQDRMRANGITP